MGLTARMPKATGLAGPPCQGAATPAAGVAAPSGDSVGRRRQPLAGAALQAAVPAGNCRPCGLAATDRAHGRLLPPRATLLPVVVARCRRCWPNFQTGPSRSRSPPCLGRGWVAGPAWGMVMAGHPSSSLPSLRKCSKNA
ncbi:hypothetical protein GW17_00055266 [Ensete ventricosum]|nr:hypothetical protein GW17_00055266 [Ensete ventricosum]